MTTLQPQGTVTHYLCIECPLGCHLEVEEDAEGSIVDIRGFACIKGRKFAEQEHTNPRRMVTTTVAVGDGRWPRLPVRTTAEVPKDKVWKVVELLRPVSVESPVTMGDVIYTDIAGTGVDVVASRDMAVESAR